MDDDLFKSKYRIPSARAYWHDYNRGYYFITICTYKREHYFGEISNNNMILTEIGLQASILLDKISMIYNGVSIPSYIIMPNHIHLIISIIKNKNIHNHDKIINNNNINEKMSDIAKKRGRLSLIISKFKTSLTRYAIKNDIPFAWQERFYDRIIRNQNEFINVDNYIKNNISNWRDDEYYSSNHP